MNDENEEEPAGKAKKKTKKLEIVATPSESSEDDNYDQVFEKTQYEGKKGHLLLQL